MDTKGFLQNWIVKNVLLAAGGVLALVVILSIGLRILTHHGQHLTVPDLVNMTVPEARIAAANAGVTVKVEDSVYIRRMERGRVYRQQPPAGAQVKRGRRIALTINSVKAKKVTMPNLSGYSLRQAKAELLAKGLMLGRLEYVSDIATNNVLAQTIRGREVPPGAQVNMGTAVDLKLGRNDEDNVTYVPRVMGLKRVGAADVLLDNSLNVAFRYDGSVHSYADSLDAVVFRQSPAPSQAPVLMGSTVTLYLSLDPEKLNK